MVDKIGKRPEPADPNASGGQSASRKRRAPKCDQDVRISVPLNSTPVRNGEAIRSYESAEAVARSTAEQIVEQGISSLDAHQLEPARVEQLVKEAQ
jgi:hypothetical protein